MSSPKFSASDLLACGWTFCGAAIVLTGLRYFVRLTGTPERRLKVDDLFHFLGLSCFIAFLASYQYLLGAIANFAAADAPPSGVPDPNATANLDNAWYQERSLQLAGALLFLSGLYMVKAAYLTLYFYIFTRATLKTFRIVWSLIVTFVGLSWIASIFGVSAGCGSIDEFFNFNKCNTPSQGQYFLVALTTWTGVLSILTDLMVISLPIFYLSRVQITKARYVLISAVFSMGLITIALDIVRIVFSITSDDYSVSTIYQYIVIGLAICISSLPPLALLTTKAGREQMSETLAPLLNKLNLSGSKLDSRHSSPENAEAPSLKGTSPERQRAYYDGKATSEMNSDKGVSV